MIEAGQISLNTATVREKCNLGQAIDLCNRYGIGGIAPWREKLHECGVDEAKRMIQDSGLRVSGLCRGGISLWKTSFSEHTG
ncbi:MAG: hypothetical protein Ct9H300mP21_09740 [Pseudomonadota bacterium]|nr:MAG: hypothetical protein Ct9H300mP21_09740 [Pseudomonadota bacterium]